MLVNSPKNILIHRIDDAASVKLYGPITLKDSQKPWVTDTLKSQIKKRAYMRKAAKKNKNEDEAEEAAKEKTQAGELELKMDKLGEER